MDIIMQPLNHVQDVTRLIFEQCKAGLNSVFPFPKLVANHN